MRQRQGVTLGEDPLFVVSSAMARGGAGGRSAVVSGVQRVVSVTHHLGSPTEGVTVLVLESLTTHQSRRVTARDVRCDAAVAGWCCGDGSRSLALSRKATFSRCGEFLHHHHPLVLFSPSSLTIHKDLAFRIAFVRFSDPILSAIFHHAVYPSCHWQADCLAPSCYAHCCCARRFHLGQCPPGSSCKFNCIGSLDTTCTDCFRM